MREHDFKEQRERLAESGGELVEAMRIKPTRCLSFLIPAIFLIVIGLAISPGVNQSGGYDRSLKIMSTIALVVGCGIFVPTVLFFLTSSVRVYENAIYLSSLTRRRVLFPEDITYIRYSEVETSTWPSELSRSIIYIKPDSGREIKLSYLSYGGSLDSIHDWQTEHEIPEPRDDE